MLGTTVPRKTDNAEDLNVLYIIGPIRNQQSYHVLSFEPIESHTIQEEAQVSVNYWHLVPCQQ